MSGMTTLPNRRIRLYEPYAIMLTIYAGFLAYAFLTAPARDILDGFYKIVTSQSLLVTDYIAVGGLQAALFNAAIVGAASVFTLMLSGVKPNGATISAMWLTVGFSFFGKNIFNMIPLTAGVWLYSKYKKEPFAGYSLAALLVATISPTVSEIGFLGIFSRPVEIMLGVLFGFFAGFIFPAISAGAVRVHGGYDLYNMGFAGGLICTVGYAIVKNVGFEPAQIEIYSEGNNVVLAVGLYAVSAALFCLGAFRGVVKDNFKNFTSIMKLSGRLVSDFYYEHGNGVYVNIGTLGIFSTTLVLALGAELNGLTIAGIFTIMGFGSFGKHIKNIIPILLGSIAAVYFNRWGPSAPSSIVPILFSTGLAPIAGQYGWVWGIIAGFIHVNIAAHTAYLSGGMNLYNNGFAAGFVAMSLLPVITIFRRGKSYEN